MRKLIKIRRKNDEFRLGEHYFYNNHNDYQSKNILLFSHQYKEKFSLIALNFGDSCQEVLFNFPFDGDYQERLHGDKESSLNLKGVKKNVEWRLTVPSNYGRIWSLEAT